MTVYDREARRQGHLHSMPTGVKRTLRGSSYFTREGIGTKYLALEQYFMKKGGTVGVKVKYQNKHMI